MMLAFETDVSAGSADGYGIISPDKLDEVFEDENNGSFEK